LEQGQRGPVTALKLRDQKEKGEVKEIGLVIEPWSVTGCYAANETTDHFEV